MNKMFWTAFIACGLAVGCSNRPAALTPPAIDADEVGQAAVEQYDRDGDGVIGGADLERAPSIEFALDRIDRDGDQKVTAEEIATHATERWLRGRTGVIRIRAKVYLDGRPLDGATVTLEPEEFMGEGIIKPASGVTRYTGDANISMTPEDLPDANAKGASPGLYLVRVTKVVSGQETIPAKYNRETTLGVEVSKRASYMPGPVEFDLRSR